MKTHNTSSPPRLVALLFGAALLGLVSQSALAAGTASGTSINNLAKLSYSVSGTAQNEICSSPTGNSTGNGGTSGTTCTSGTNGASNTTFVVDNKVNLTVVKVSDLTTVPGTTKQALRFTVTNNGNTPQRYALSAVAGAATITTMTNVAIYRDDGGTPGAWDGTDTLYVNAGTFGDVAADGSLSILIVADTPVGATNGQTAIFDLVATTVDAGTTTVTTQTAGANTAGVDVVFADIAGSAAGDGARDGKHSASATYTIGSSIISVAKTVTVLCDPFNGVTNPKNIPGAIVQYSIAISNGAGAGASATLATITDTLAATLAHDANLVVPTDAATCSSATGTPASGAGKGFKVTSSVSRNMGGTAGGGAATTSYFTTANDADGVEYNAALVTATYATILPTDGGHATAGLLKAGETVTVIFNTTVQ